MRRIAFARAAGWIAFVTIIATLGAFAGFVWPTPYRQLPVPVQPANFQVLAARENRFTGTVQLLTIFGWVVAEAADSSRSAR
jgi:hypothetical protein